MFTVCLPLFEDSYEFKQDHSCELISYDHIHPRCTIGQFIKETGLALFLGSTVPHKRYIEASLKHKKLKSNMLLTGYYNDYRKGWHKPGKESGHEAFRQDNRLPIRRTYDDLVYDNDDRVEYVTPFDNLHAGWCNGPDHEYFASAGCQVIVGYPKCVKRKGAPDSGPWYKFKGVAYALEQKSFDYMLLNGSDANKISNSKNEKLSARLRFGSVGDLVSEVQDKLRILKYYEGVIDGKFGSRTLRALLEFQEDSFGIDGDDGIVGPITASALNIAWPKI